MVYAMLARPILALARARPMVRMIRPIRSLWSAKTCSTRAWIADFRRFARAVSLGIGLPGGFLRWIRLTLPRPAR